MAMASITDMNNKLNLVLEKLEHIEELLTVEDELPLDDEMASIRAYMIKKADGKSELVRLEDVIDAI